ncbi:hypothetical protein pipiens_017440, partial [Culex pipiens pipiens]
NCDVHLQAEIEVLKNALADKHSQLVAMENACLVESDRQVELEDSIIAWQDKYERLYESHKRVQKVNQNLEDKLLKLVDRNAGERAQLTSDVATLSVRLAQANYNVQSLKREIVSIYRRNFLLVTGFVVEVRGLDWVPGSVNILATHQPHQTTTGKCVCVLIARKVKGWRCRCEL